MPRWTLLAAALLLVVAPAQAMVTITFAAPEHYTDATIDNNRLPAARQAVLRDLRKFFIAEAAKIIPADQTLSIMVTDIDLAGQYEPWHGRDDTIRYYRDTTWPSLKLHYTLTAEDRVLKSGDAILVDRQYLMRPNPYPATDLYRYEKNMITTWFATQFAKP